MKKATISAKKVLVTSFLVDLLDIAMNLAVAIITGSVVMLAELLQGIADLTAAGFLLIGLKRSEIPADKTYPFGHGREMYFWTLLSSDVMLAVTAGLSFYFGFRRF
ncbi:MAG: Cation diffusion facilitator family transporter, partial [Candidatus Curtissbacteria bacterium GW2011_GWD1_40_8]